MPPIERFVAVICGVLAAALPARADTLIDALTNAYLYNTDLQGARAHLRGIDEQVPQALSGWLPTVSIASSGGYQTLNSGTGYVLPRPYGFQQGTYGGNVQVKQPLYEGGATTAGIAQAEANVRAGRADLLGTEQTVLMSAANAYDDVLRARAVLALDREVERALRQQLRETTLRMEAGQLTQTDIDQTAAQLAAAVATRIGAESDLAGSNARFVASVGRPPGEAMQLHASPPGLPKSDEEAVRIAEANSPTVIASLFRLKAAQQAVTVAQAALLPNLSVTASAGYDQGQTSATAPTKQASLTVNLAVPIYQGGALASQVRQAKDAASESQITTLSTRRDARMNTETAYANWRSAVNRLAQQIEQVRLARSAYEGVRKEAAVGAKSTFELLVQLQDLVNARSAEVQARYDVSTNAYQLLVYIGRFTGADLHVQAPIYDPAEHYQAVREKLLPLP